jgi:hypothetical protein
LLLGREVGEHGIAKMSECGLGDRKVSLSGSLLGLGEQIIAVAMIVRHEDADRGHGTLSESQWRDSLIPIRNPH